MVAGTPSIGCSRRRYSASASSTVAVKDSVSGSTATSSYMPCEREIRPAIRKLRSAMAAMRSATGAATALSAYGLPVRSSPTSARVAAAYSSRSISAK